ncbi:MAG: hypothetical protein ACYCVH_15430 [Ignavibacteriaceae bacterium]
MEQKKFIRILINNHLALRIKLVESPKHNNPIQGEVDIFIDSAKKKYFDETILSNAQGFQKSNLPVNKISWHGYYSKINDKIQLPVINFKSNNDKIATFRHTGNVNQKDIFLLPICSIYIPSYFSNVDLPSLNEDNSHIVKLDSETHSRIDFFVLPKFIDIKRFFNDFAISIFYLTADITIFNKYLNAEFNPLPVKSDDNVKFIPLNLSGWDVLLRILYTNETREPFLIGKYSILFNDPSDSISMLLNRKLVYQDISNPKSLEWSTVSERHNSDITKFLNK